MPDPDDYSNVDIKPVTLREAVQRRPNMWFGDHPNAEWPLVITMWTAQFLLEYVSEDVAKVKLTLHHGGSLSAAVHGASLTRYGGHRFSLEELVRRRMWWIELTHCATVTVSGTDGPDAGQQPSVDGGQTWNNLSIDVRLEIEPQLIGVAPDAWWYDGLNRLRRMADSPDFQLAANHTIVVTDEASAAVVAIESDTAKQFLNNSIE